MKDKIILLGMMGSGKTTVAKILAELTGIKNYELDEIFEKENSTSIKDFFKLKGENEFRKKETELLKKVLVYPSFIISTGGGVILKKENRDLIFKKDYLSIYLKTSSETIFERIKEDKTRPLLLVNNPKSEIEKLIKLREQYYLQAKLTIETDNKTPKQIASEIRGIL